MGDKVLLSTKNLPPTATTCTASSKLAPRFIGPFQILERVGQVAYKLDIPASMKLHPTFYRGLLKRYVDPMGQSEWGEDAAHQDPMVETVGQPEAVPATSVDSQSESVALRASGAAGATQMRAPASGSVSLAPGQLRPARLARATSLREESSPQVARQQNLSSTLQGTFGSKSGSSRFPDHGSKTIPRANRSNACNKRDTRKPRRPVRAPPALLDSSGSKRYIVEAIVGKRNAPGPEVLVKWRGFPTPTWEPRSTMVQDVPDLIATYDRA